MTKSILITAAGSGPSNNLMRSVAEGMPGIVLVGCHFDRFLLKKSSARRNFLVPPLDTSPGCEALLQILAEADVDLVMPGNDRDARALTVMRERIPSTVRLLLPSLRTIDLCQDKGALSGFLRQRGIPAPRTYPITDQASLADAWDKLAPSELAWCRIRRGFASRGAIQVRDCEQAWSWISYWLTMRGVPVEDFTLCEYLPGRDFNVQALCSNGALVLIKMCERLSYLNADHHPSGMASTPAVAKTVWEPAAIETCRAALGAIDCQATGVFSIDLKEDASGVACITEINAGRFCMITNIHDFTGRHNMAATYVKLAFGEPAGVDDPCDAAGEHYLVRDLDTLPTILAAGALFHGIERVPTARTGASIASM